jgi:hypothetical protein
MKKLELKKITLLSDEEQANIVGLTEHEMSQIQGGYMLDEITIYGGNILPYANLQFSDTHNKVLYAFEAAINTVGIAYNGFVWVWNRTGAQW